MIPPQIALAVQDEIARGSVVRRFRCYLANYSSTIVTFTVSSIADFRFSSLLCGRRFLEKFRPYTGKGTKQ